MHSSRYNTNCLIAYVSVCSCLSTSTTWPFTLMSLNPPPLDEASSLLVFTSSSDLSICRYLLAQLVYPIVSYTLSKYGSSAGIIAIHFSAIFISAKINDISSVYQAEILSLALYIQNTLFLHNNFTTLIRYFYTVQLQFFFTKNETHKFPLTCNFNS